MKPMTIKDIAKICGVGVTTVSRAINNHPDINEETKQMIMKAIEEHNYIPNNSARNLKRTDSKTIAVLIKGISNPFFSDMIKTFQEEIQKRKYTFILQKVDNKENEVNIAIELEKEKRLRGIVFLGGSFSHTEEDLKQLKVPFVLSTISQSGLLDRNIYSSVSVDDVKESYKIVDYLCSLGHKNIAVLAATEDDKSIGKLRLEGYMKALKKNSIELKPSLIRYMKEDVESFSIENGYLMTKELLESKKEFTAIYAICDTMAIGACKAIFDANKQVPLDYSVAGFDGLKFASYYNPSITTIKQPVEAMAKETLRILFDLIENNGDNDHRVFEAELMEGESTRKI